MSKLKQCFSWWCVSRAVSDPAQFFRQIAAIGFRGVELLPRELWGVARDAGLVVVTHAGHESLTDGLNRRENHARIEDEIGKMLEAAVQYQIPCLICFSGNRNGLGDEEGAANTIAGLQRVAKAAEAKGVTLILELLNSKVDHKDYQCDHTAWGVQVVKAVNSPRVKLLYDIYHMQIMEGDIIRTIRDNIAHIGHFHTAGNPGRRDMDDTQELNYRGIAQAIVDTGYDGYLGHEFEPKGDPLAARRAAYELCDVG